MPSSVLAERDAPAMARPRKYPDELASGRCGSCLSRSVRSRTSPATWTSTRRPCVSGCYRSRPIAAAGAMPLSVSGIIPSRLLLEQGSSWVGPGVPQVRAAAELTYGTVDSLITGGRPPWTGCGGDQNQCRSRSQDAGQTRGIVRCPRHFRTPAGYRCTRVASEAGRNPPKGDFPASRRGCRINPKNRRWLGVGENREISA
jgi:hypothetical protein